MNNRTKIIGIMALVIGVFPILLSAILVLPLFKESQAGTFTVASCSIQESGRRPDRGFCYGTFTPDSGELINKNPQNSVDERTDFASGTVLSARLYKDGTVVTNTSATTTNAIQFGLFGVVFLFIGVALLFTSRKKLNAKNAAVGQVVTGQGLPALTQNVSTWSHVALFSSIGCILLIPGPIAFMSGVVGIVDSRANHKVGVWRAWLGVAVGLVATIALIIVIANFTKAT